MLQVQRLHITIYGAVQGVGFRPFIYRLAKELNLKGWVVNSSRGVIIEAEGEKRILEIFLLRIEKEKPPRAIIQSFEHSFLDPIGYNDFEIRQSEILDHVTAFVMPDIATCSDCLSEVFDSNNRRYLYPFTNCTNCGPRFSIIERLPYDRHYTTMKNFTMCEECLSEYNNPLDRRFHAQPNACPTCGPHVELWDSYGKKVASHNEAIQQTVNAIHSGKIVAVKGLGGFHLMVGSHNNDSVKQLRKRKHREEKPFALMFPSIESVKKHCHVSALEERLLISPETPIVLLKRKFNTDHLSLSIASSVAPNNPYFGVMLPYTPLHHILMRELGIPVVATSGNLSDEPICIDENEAIIRLKKIADYFLVHNRPIIRHVDDSVVRVMMGRELVLRRARGYAPLPIQLNKKSTETILAVGAHLKNTVALTSSENVFISQHIGDLETKEAYVAFKNVIDSFMTLYNKYPDKITTDLHPSYLSTQYARETRIPTLQVQHHCAHIISCMAENQVNGQVLGVSWDGTGFGFDGTIWGGEFLLTDENSFNRVATFRQFRLPGGEQAIKEPRRTAIGVLYELFNNKIFDYEFLSTLSSCSKTERLIFLQMLNKQINSPITSSVGRLFDAVASIIGLKQFVSFEGQAAMELEFTIGNNSTTQCYKWSMIKNQIKNMDEKCSTLSIVIDWGPIILDVIEDVKNNTHVSIISAKFHNTLSEIVVDIAKQVSEKKVVLSGGCFQNKYLTERTVQRLTEEGFNVYWHQRVPPNDGGISLGQIVAAINLNNATSGKK